MSNGTKITQRVTHAAPPAAGTALGALTWHSATPAVICGIICTLIRYVVPFVLEEVRQDREHRRSEASKNAEFARSEASKNAEFARAATSDQFALYKTKNVGVKEISVGQQPTATSGPANGPTPRAVTIWPRRARTVSNWPTRRHSHVTALRLTNHPREPWPPTRPRRS